MNQISTYRWTRNPGIRALAFAFFVTGVLTVSTLAQETKSASPPLSREESILVQVTATVQAIDLAKREVTLKGPLGNVVTFVVDERMKRLDEVKVGHQVTADYYVSLVFERRAPPQEEKNSP